MKRTVIFLTLAALLLPLFAFSACKCGETRRNEYCIAAEYASGVLTAEMDFTYYNAESEEMSALEFNLFGNAYREDAQFKPVSNSYFAKAYYEGKSYGEMNITEVSPCASWEVCGQDENILRVELETPVSPGDSAEITVCYTLTLAHADHRTGVARKAVNLGNFYPILCVYDENGGFYECEYYSNGDPFYSECADYSVTFTADTAYSVASSGQVLSAKQSGTKKTYEMKLENARDFAIALSDDYELAQGTAGDVTVLYYYYDDADAQARLALICDCLSYFCEKFGAYPYKTFSAVQTGFCYGGMEYPGLVMLSDALSEKSYNYTAVHETAHQWWYAAVGNNQLENAWLDEGLAEYSTALFFESHTEYGLDKGELLESAYAAYKAFYGVQQQVFGKSDTTMNRHLREFSEYEYISIAYDKGMILFDTLRDALGDSRFFAGLKRYYSANAGKTALPEDLESAFKNAGAAGVIRSFMDGSAVI